MGAIQKQEKLDEENGLAPIKATARDK